MPLSLFDLDNTLITNDSDFLWGQYLVDNGIVDQTQYEERNRQFFADYERGTLDIDEYLKFSLQPLAMHEPKQLFAWRQDFVSSVIQPLIASGAQALLDKHRSRGDTLMIISATNLFITQPIADLLEVPYILATEPEIRNGRYTGNYLGQPTYRQGKVTALRQWLEEHGMNLTGSTFYSDSHNDLPLLQRVDNPVGVNPDHELLKICHERRWPVVDLRNGPSR